MCANNISTAPASSLLGSAASASTFGAIPAGGGLFGCARGDNHDWISIVGFMLSIFSVEASDSSFSMIFSTFSGSLWKRTSFCNQRLVWSW